jgi:hypothetical protein
MTDQMPNPSSPVAPTVDLPNGTTGSAAHSGGAKMADTAAATQTTVDKVREEAASFATEATGAARQAATQGKDKAAEALGGLSKLAEDAARAVDQHLGPSYGDYARKASSTVAQAADKLQSKDVDTLIADAGAYARKRPAIVFGTLAAVGVVLAGIFLPRGSKDDTKA